MRKGTGATWRGQGQHVEDRDNMGPGGDRGNIKGGRGNMGGGWCGSFHTFFIIEPFLASLKKYRISMAAVIYCRKKENIMDRSPNKAAVTKISGLNVPCHWCTLISVFCRVLLVRKGTVVYFSAVYNYFNGGGGGGLQTALSKTMTVFGNGILKN
jgi:hypothetical protein